MKCKSLLITAISMMLIIALIAGCSGNANKTQESENNAQSTKTITYLSFSASPAVLNLQYGTILKLSGRLRAKGESGLSDKTVLIQSKEGSNWTTIYTLTTDKNGYYTKKYTPDVGTYYFRAKYEGDSDYKPCESHEQKAVVK